MLRRPGRGMVRHERGVLKRPAVFQIRRDTRRPKRMVAHARGDAGGFRASLNHHIGIRLGQGIAGELAGRAAVGLEQERLRIARESCAVDVGVKVGFKVVMARHGVLLAAVLV